MIRHLLRQSAVLLCVLTHCSFLVSQTLEESAPTISFCALSRRPDKYKNSLVTLRVRVTSFRHGTLMSDRSCPEQMIGIIPEQSVLQAASVSHFYQVLRQHRQSEIPVFATITGRLVRESQSEFVKRDVVFKLESVSEILEGDQPRKP